MSSLRNERGSVLMPGRIRHCYDGRYESFSVTYCLLRKDRDAAIIGQQ